MICQQTKILVRGARRSGLSLIEMVVVLFIMAAVAGIAVTAMTNIGTETHGSTGAAMITGLDSAMRVAEARKGYVGANGYDSLVNESGSVYTGLMGPNWATKLTVVDLAGGGSVSSLDTTKTVTAARVQACLEGAGIESVYTMVDDPTASSADATFANTTTLNALSATKIAALNSSSTDLMLDPEGIYVAFGVGEQSLLTGGNVIAEAPVFMPGTGSARDIYSNLIVIYEIPESGPAIAQYAGCGMPMMGGIMSATHHLNVYHQGRDE